MVLALLVVPATRHLIRFYPSGPPQPIPTVDAGVLYWPHVVYSNALVLTGSAILLITVMRVSRLYWRQSITLLVAICLPLIGNAMTDFNAPPFEHLDPSPLATSLAAWVLVFGVLRYRLLDLRPVARTHVVETMRDAVLVADAHGHVVDLNPAALALLGRRAGELVGSPVAALLSEFADPTGYPDPGVYDVRWAASGAERDMELVVTALEDARGVTAGRVLVFRDVTERRELERELRRLAYTDPSHRLAEPGVVPRPARAGAGHGQATRRSAGRLVPGPRSVQDHQRQPRPRDRRRGARVGRPAATTLPARRGHPRAAGRRRVRGPAAQRSPNRRDSRLVTDKCLSALSDPRVIGGHELTVNASIGVAIFPQDGADVQHLLAQRGRCHVPRQGPRRRTCRDVHASARTGGRPGATRLEVELRRGLRTGQLRVLFQPYRELCSGTARWLRGAGALEPPTTGECSCRVSSCRSPRSPV